MIPVTQSDIQIRGGVEGYRMRATLRKEETAAERRKPGSRGLPLQPIDAHPGR